MAKQATEPKVSERSVEDIEADLQLPETSGEESVSEEESGSEQELSSEDDDEDEEEDEEEEDIEGLSGDNEEEETKHTVNLSSLKKSASSAKSTSKDSAGVIYIGRIPHGFFEKEMKKYFSQFGDIKRIRLSRNKKTGKSKHFGYIQFESKEVAKIAAETMNNYLVAGHLLKVEYVENAKPNLFIGDHDRKFRVIPRQQISMKKYNEAKTQEEWDKLQDQFNAKKVAKVEHLKAKGINYSI